MFHFIFRYFIPYSWHPRAKKCFHAKVWIIDEIIFCDYLNFDIRQSRGRGRGRGWSAIMDYSAFLQWWFCRNGNHEAKWAARIMLISTVIYKFCSKSIFYCAVPPSAPPWPQLISLLRRGVAIKFKMHSQRVRVNWNYYERESQKVFRFNIGDRELFMCFPVDKLNWTVDEENNKFFERKIERK